MLAWQGGWPNKMFVPYYNKKTEMAPLVWAAFGIWLYIYTCGMMFSMTSSLNNGGGGKSQVK